VTIKESYMSVVSSELTIAELEAVSGEFLPAREEMNITFNRRVRISNFGRRAGTTIADGNVVFGDVIITTIKKA
jgi:hypothetical protein